MKFNTLGNDPLNTITYNRLRNKSQLQCFECSDLRYFSKMNF